MGKLNVVYGWRRSMCRARSLFAPRCPR